MEQYMHSGLMEQFNASLEAFETKAISLLTSLKLVRAGDGLKISNMDIPNLTTFLTAIALGWFIFSRVYKEKKNLPPALPGGLPIIGHIRLLREVKIEPQRTYTAWAEKYGPIYRYKAGARNVVVVSSAALAKEVLVTKYDSISKRQLPTAFQVLSSDKVMVSMSDYGNEHRLLKKVMVGQLTGSNPQKANRAIREETISGMVNRMRKGMPVEGADIAMRKLLQDTLVPYAMRQVLGFGPEEADLPGLGEISVPLIVKTLITDAISTVMLTDWRNMWPMFSWVPNNSMKRKLDLIIVRKDTMIQGLLNICKEKGPTPGCLAEYLLSDAAKDLTEKQVRQLAWESIITSVDTSVVTSEWIMCELATHPHIQQRLYNEIINEVGDRIMNEDDLPNLPLLDAVFKETLRRHCPVSTLPARLVETDITLGGYDIPKGWDVVVNQWGIGMNKKVWSDPECWDPDRCLGDRDIDLGIKDFRITPFGGGKRLCVGNAQATTIISILIGTLVQQFEWASTRSTTADDSMDVNKLTSHRATPLHVFAKSRIHAKESA